MVGEQMLKSKMLAAAVAVSFGSVGVAGDARPAEAEGPCPAATVTVSTPTSLQIALADAQPGSVIQIEDGVYDGNWTATTPGTEAQPIWLCGGPGAELTNDGYSGSYGLHLDGASWWHLYGFTVRWAQKGVVVDAATHVTVEGLTVHDLGDEGIHLRTNTVDSVVTGNTIYSTGHRRDKFGEGVYVGSANGNWSVYTGGQPDRSDRNIVASNTIYQTTAEPIDVKEGTTGTQVLGNALDGAALTDAGGDSCTDIKGNDGLVSGNLCTGLPGGDGHDGYQVHHNKLIRLGLGDWGLRNEFTGNTANIGPGARDGFWIHDASTTYNVVRCGQTVTGAAYANVTCTP